MEENLKHKTAKGIFWGGLSNGLQQLLGVIFGVVLLRELTPGDYGMIGMLAIFTGIANTVQESGFTAALTNRKIFDPKDYNAVFWFNLIVGSSFYVLLYFSAPLIAEYYNQPELIPLSRVLFLAIIASSLGIAHNAVLFREMLVKERAKIDVLSSVVAGIVGITLAVMGYGYWALAIQTLVYASMSTFLRWRYSPWKPSFSFDLNPIREMFGFSSKMLFSTIVYQIQGNIFSILLGRFYTVADVGYYSQGTKWSGMGAQVINGTLSNIFQPLFVKYNADKTKQLALCRKMLRLIGFLSFPVLLGFAFVSEDFIRMINIQWLPSVPLIQIYCVWGAFSPIYILYSQVMISRGDSRCYLYSNLVFSMVQIISVFCILELGIYWIAMVSCALSFLMLFYWQRLIKRKLGLGFFMAIKDIAPYLFIVLFDFFIVWLITNQIQEVFIKLLIKILLSVILYMALLYNLDSVIYKEAYFYLLKKKENDE